MNNVMVLRFVKFILERHKIYMRKKQKLPRPWTSDKILQQYRFCNVYRELDTVTSWIATRWREPHAKDKNLWFAMVVARLVNWPDTLHRMGYPTKWNPTLFQHVLRDIQETGGKAYSGAYIVSTNGRAMLKEKYLAEQVLTPLWEARADIMPTVGDTLAGFHAKLAEFQGMGSFMAAQVVADVKYVHPLKGASDWWVFAASGPGSRRGLNRVMNYDVNSPWRERDWWEVLRSLSLIVNKAVVRASMPRLHNQDLQNCLCEFDKYERTRLGQGRPRSTYQGEKQ